MKKLLLVTALATVAACSQADTEPTEIAAADDVADTVVLATDGLPVVGSYSVTGPDGATYESDYREDGTFTQVAAGGETFTGTYTQESPVRFCSKGDSEESMTCYAEAMRDDGTWSATNETKPDDVWIVTRKPS